jgi:Protein of unknown function (DUF2934)
MARKQAIVKETAAAAAPKTARAAKPKTPRVTAAKHSKSVSTESATAQTGTDNQTEVIAKIAYGYWESRGGHGGSALEDWVRAEREYVARHVERASA